MNAIEIRELTKKYKEKTAVDSLTLDIGQGELFSLLGVNGAGKTTTIRMLCGLSAPTSGDAFLLGDSVTKTPHKVKKKINISPQETAFARNLTVTENLLLIAGIYGFEPSEARERAAAMTESFALGEYAKYKACKLSGGTQRRLSIAMALISDPQILFLDEPTLGLDVLARRELWGHIQKLKGKMTVILTTHYMEEAEKLSDRVGIMSRGRLIDTDTPRALIEKTGADSFEDAFIALAGEAGADKDEKGVRQ